MLFVVGLGLGDERDITVKGLEAVKSSERVYLEAYTSVLGVGQERLEKFYGKQLTLADREMVESNSDEIFRDAENVNVSFLVVGDPYGATTHTDLVLRAKKRGIPVEVIHNASIMNAIACCGLQLYNFGQTVTVVFFTDTWRPDSFYDKIKQNKDLGLHTLCLLDIKMKEPTIKSLLSGKTREYEPPRFLDCSTAAAQLLEIEEKRKEGVCSPQTLVIGLARVGQTDQKIVATTLEKMTETDMGLPLHSMVIPGHMHELEQEMVDHFRV
eukprot:c18206_g1_i1.p1 GENE.c18206_g1_i1~~c18206_g1_i1.p1  ORF type:complete len:289 (+),score=67.72 c18206_g1_i1:63-869(+)